MKITATELMKKLKFIEEELNDIYSDDKTNSTVLMEKKTDKDGKTTYDPAFANEYDFASNRKKVKELFDEEKESICALNFASYKNPGGKFMDGSSAQEECLCHESILYEVLSAVS